MIIASLIFIIIVLGIIVQKVSKDIKNSDCLYYNNYTDIYDEIATVDTLNYFKKKAAINLRVK